MSYAPISHLQRDHDRGDILISGFANVHIGDNLVTSATQPDELRLQYRESKLT